MTDNSLQIGLEFRDSAFNIGPKCSRKIKSNMTFSLALSFADLEDPTDKKKTYALQIIDTVVAGANGGKLLSDGLKSTPDMTFFFRDSGDRKPAKAAQNGKDSGAKKGQATMVAPRKGRLRNDGKEVDSEAQNRRKEHQRELAERRQEEGLARFAEDDGSGKANEAKQWKRFESYQREKDLPSAVAKRKVGNLIEVYYDQLLTSLVDLRRHHEAHLHPSDTWLCGAIPHQHAQERRQARRGRVHDAPVHVRRARSDHR